MDCSVFCGTCWSKMTRLLNTAIIGATVEIVTSSRVDVLAGLSRCAICRTPPGFCANAGTAAINANNSAALTSSPGSFPIICFSLRGRLFVEPDVLHAPAVEQAVDHDRQALDLG